MCFGGKKSSPPPPAPAPAPAKDEPTQAGKDEAQRFAEIRAQNAQTGTIIGTTDDLETNKGATVLGSTS
jgi:hypothetical protein